MKHYSFNWGECSNYAPRPLKEGRVFCESCKAITHPVCYACGWEGGHTPNDLACLNNKVRTLTEQNMKLRNDNEVLKQAQVNIIKEWEYCRERLHSLKETVRCF